MGLNLEKENTELKARAYLAMINSLYFLGLYDELENHLVEPVAPVEPVGPVVPVAPVGQGIHVIGEQVVKFLQKDELEEELLQRAKIFCY
ncbi:hypothetical protein ACLMAB_17350 [Brevibacillus laterosporus]